MSRFQEIGPVWITREMLEDVDLEKLRRLHSRRLDRSVIHRFSVASRVFGVKLRRVGHEPAPLPEPFRFGRLHRKEVLAYWKRLRWMALHSARY